MRKCLDRICYIMIIIVGIIDILYGTNHQIKQYNFMKKAIKTTANIYQTSYQDSKQVLYINFYVGNQEYDGILILKDKETDKSTITIYYDKNNPLNFTTDEIDKSGLLFIVMGVIFTLMGTLSFLRYCLTNNK